MAAYKRAQSARAGLGQTLLDRQTRAAQLHDAAQTSMERARRYVALLRDTEKVRLATFQHGRNWAAARCSTSCRPRRTTSRSAWPTSTR